MNKNNLQCRRDKVIELYSEARNQREIAKILKINQPTIHRDLQYERQRIKNRLETYLDEHFPFEHNVCTVGVNKILRRAWDIAAASNIPHSQVMQALSLAKDCYRMKLELLDSETIIDKAIEFVESRKEINGTFDRHTGFTPRS
jgi:hypothetical protein